MIEKTVLSHLVYNEEYTRRTLPFLKSEYFQNPTERMVFDLVDAYVKTYNDIPSKEALLIELDKKDNLNETAFKSTMDYVQSIDKEESNIEWLLDTTEKFCQDKAIYNAIMQSIKILDDKSGTSAKGSIPKILADALGVSFQTNIGHDYLENADDRFEFYHRTEDRIKFDLDLFNKVTKGGLPRKTLNIILAGTGVGKTLFMTHCASANMMDGKNVLYITMEMAEERIAERIDANLLNVRVDELSILTKDAYDKKVEKIRSKTVGKLIVKEYPTASAGSANFRYLLNELRLKKNFVPDIIYIDYLNICSSSRVKAGSNVNSYTLIKSIAEELRGLAVEFNIPVVSATQTNRSGFSDSDVGLENTSDSFGLPMTADLMFAIITSEELEGLGQLMIKQLKNRYNDPTFFRRFVVGVDRSKMRLYDVEQSAQDDILDDNPTFDKSKFAEESDNRKKKLKDFFN
jgi:replicative DNA helicase